MINKKVFGETKNKLIKINILVVSSFLIIFSLFTYFYFQEITYNSIDETLKEEYDYIIIDTPPVLSVTDPQLLALKADGTLLVVREGIAKHKLVLAAYKELEKVQVNVVGTVLNDCEEKTKGYSKYYYQYEEDAPPKGRKKRRK